MKFTSVEFLAHLGAETKPKPVCKARARIVKHARAVNQRIKDADIVCVLGDDALSVTRAMPARERDVFASQERHYRISKLKENKTRRN